MAASNTIDLARLQLRPGEGRRLEADVRPGDLEYAGQRYATPAAPARGRLDVSRMASGYAFRLRYEVELEGPCMRCLADARVRVSVDAREVDQPGAGDELDSPYVEGEDLRLAAWAHDALALALPPQLLCRPDCAGLCPVCGESLNDVNAADHEHERPLDPRWQKLRELKLD